MILWTRSSSAADLKFLHRVPRVRLRNFKSKSGTRLIELLVPFGFRSSYSSVPRCITNFENRALADTAAGAMSADHRDLVPRFRLLSSESVADPSKHARVRFCTGDRSRDSRPCDSRLLSSCRYLGRWPSGCEYRFEHDECPACSVHSIPGYLRRRGSLPSRAIRDVLQKIRVKISCAHSIKRESKTIREHGRVQNWLLIDFPPPRACYSCNTLLKRVGGSGDSSAFSLCRGFG